MNTLFLPFLRRSSQATVANDPFPDDDAFSPFGAMIAMAAIVVAAGMTAGVGGSPIAVCGVALFVALIAGAILARGARKRAHWLMALRSDYHVELDKWRNLLQTNEQQAAQTTSALEKMRDGVILLAESGEILLINPAACWLLEVDEKLALHGRAFNEVVRIPELKHAIAESRVGEDAQKQILEILHGGGIRPVKARVDRFATGTVNKILITLRDETEINRVDEMRREFVANISHELKTPLAAIKGYAETVELAIEDDPTAAKHFMNQIHTQCLRLERLISDMMQLARAQAGRSYLTITTVEVVDVIAESMRSHQPIAETKNIELYVVPSEQKLVMSDREATLTIANNLIGNAIRYTPNGGHVRVGCCDADDFVALFVQDDGVGIPEAEQKRIFERFYRVEKPRRTRDGSGHEGTGIGLSIVKNLTLSLGGHVRVTSGPGKGAKFEVLLPRAS